MRRTARLLVLPLACAGAVILAAPVAATPPDSAVQLPMTDVREVLVDDAHSHVFLTGGGSNGVVVRDLAGTAVTIVADQPGAEGMALSPDGGTLYVALYNGDAVSAIDTVTLTEKARYATGAGTCPVSVAAVGTSVWFGYGCTSAASDLGVIELSGDTPAVTLDLSPVALTAPPIPYISAAEPGRLVTFNWTTIYVFTIADGALTTSTSRDITRGIRELALTPDGQHVVAAAVSEPDHPRYRVSDLSGDGVYGTETHPTSVAVAANGYVASGSDSHYDERDLFVHTADGVLRRQYELHNGCCGTPHEAYDPVARTLALTTDASRLFVAGQTDYHGFWLLVLHDPAKALPKISFTKPAAPKVKTAYAVKGAVSAVVPVPQGSVLHVKRTSTYGTVALKDVTTGTNGAFTVTDTVGKRGRYTYTVTWDGGPDHASAAASTAFTVMGLTPPLSIVTDKSAYRYHAYARILVRLGTSGSSNRKVNLFATPEDGNRALIGGGTVDRDGYLRDTYRMSRRTYFTASFAGDEVYEPRRVTRAANSHAWVQQSVSGHYGASGGYKLFRRSVDPKITTYVQSYQPACVEMVVQRYTSGAWRLVTTRSCLTFEHDGRAHVLLTGDPMTGVPYRVRSKFMGNTWNLPTYSAYSYFKFT
jgi:YVTN family beta-propeller protein